MLDASPVPAPVEPRPPRPFREYHAPSRAGVALQLVFLVVATTVVIGLAAAAAFAGVLYRLLSFVG